MSIMRISMALAAVCVLILAGVVTASSPPAEGNLVAHWKFDEANGDKLTDASGNGNHGKIHGPKWGKGISGGALEFDGVDDYVVIPKSASLNSPKKGITVSAWVKTPLSDRHTILARWDYEGDANDRSLLLEVRGKKKMASFALSPDGGGSAWCNSPDNAVPKDEWVHVVGVGDGRTMRVFVNGKQCVSLDDAAYRVFAAKGDLYMGIWDFGKGKKSGPFKGLIDEVKIYSRAMSANEVLKLYGDFGAKGKVSGKVTDAKGKAIKQAFVSVGLFCSMTGADGAYSLAVPPGKYKLRVFKSGYTRQLIDVQVEKDKTTAAATVSMTEDKVKPEISNISVWSPASSVTVVEWKTNEPCAGDVVCKLFPRTRDKALIGRDASWTKSHRVILSGLKSDTKYRFWILNHDLAGNGVQSKESTFTTSSDHAEKGLVAYWKFDAGKGDMIFDASGNGNHGYINGPAAWAKGKVAGGLKFNGKDNYVRIRKSPSLNSPNKEITLTVWIKTPLTQRGTIFGRFFYYRKRAGGERSIELDVNSARGGMNFALSSDGSTSAWCGSSAQVIPKDEWVHVTAVSDGKTMKYYFNGREDIFTAIAPEGGIHSSATDLFLGAWYANGRFSCLFDGVIDEARIYSRALTGAEILKVYSDTCPKGTISGKVLSSGKPITQTKVSVGLFSATTDNDGAFSLNIPVGTYRVTIAKKGYKTLAKDVELAKGKTVTLKLPLTKDDTGPKITKMNTDKTANYTALIEWETDERAISTVRYWLSESPLSVKEPSGVKYHRVLITGLKPATKYHFAVECTDEAGNTTKSKSFRFTTKKLPETITWSTKPGPRDKNIGPDIPLTPQETKDLANRITVKGFTTADVQAACDKAKADGVPVVYLPAGKYIIKGVNIPAGITLLGAGSKTYVSSVKNGQVFQAIGDGVRLTRMKLYGMNPTFANVSDSICLRAFNVKNIRVDHCEVMAFSRALYFGKGATGQVDHNIIHHNCWSGLGYGIISVNDGTMVLVYDNIFHSNRHTVTSNYGEAHYLFRYNHVLDVKDCAPRDNLSQCDVHAHLTPKGAFVVEYNIFENCKGALGCWAGRGVVRGNVFRNLNYAIYVTSKVPHEIGDNTFEKVRKPYMGVVSGKSKMPNLKTVPYMLEMDATGVIQILEKDTAAYYTGSGKAQRDKIR